MAVVGVRDGNLVATDAAGFADVRERGLLLWEKMTTVYDSSQTGVSRLCHIDFLKLPSRADYADYYDILKKPISYAEIQTKLDRLEYSSLNEIRNDFNQVFVNAKRYNAPGSPIFLDARRLHRVLKDSYPVLTGEAPPPPEEDEGASQRGESVAPEGDDVPSPIALTGNISQDPLSGLIKGTTLKQWLLEKLAQIVQLQDGSGRSYAATFQRLPDKKTSEDYFRAIANPLSFELIAMKIDNRSYTAVAQFTDDVSTLLSNAVFWNESQSPLWLDAQALLAHFDRLMSEPIPLFIPPRKYNALKRKAEADADARGQPLVATKRSHHRGAAEKLRQVAAERAAQAAQELAVIEAEEMLQEEMENGGEWEDDFDPFAIPEHVQGQVHLAEVGLSLGRTREGSIAGSPAPETGRLQSLPPVVGRNFAGDIVAKAIGPFSQPHAGNGAGQDLPPTSTRLRPLSRVSTLARPSTIAFFSITASTSSAATASPSAHPPLVLSCAQTRSHSISIPRNITRIEFAPSFTITLKAEHPTPPLKALARPLGTPLEAAADLPPPGQKLKAGSSGVKYVLVPQREGVTTVEFSIQPRGEGQEGEVFRLFVSRRG